MTNVKCYNCKEGLVGLGESIGSKKVCPVCKGTGFSDEVAPLSKINENKTMSYKTQELKDEAIATQEKVVAEAKGQPAINEAKAKLVEIKDSEVVAK